MRAARALLQTHSGRLIELQAQGQRLVSFRIGLGAHTLDPNRIFTDDGLAATLRRLGPDSPAARAAGRTLREGFWRNSPPLTGAPWWRSTTMTAKNTRSTTSSPAADWRATRPRSRRGRASSERVLHRNNAGLFAPLAADGFNVVQQSAGATDDGSLSIWAHRAGRPYINVEAGEGRLAEQLGMLEAVARHFATPRL